MFGLRLSGRGGRLVLKTCKDKQEQLVWRNRPPGFFYGPARGGGGPVRLTRNHEDEDGGGHARVDVEHESEVVRQLHQVVDVGHKHGGDEEADGTTQLQQTRGESEQVQLSAITSQHLEHKKNK